MPTVIDPIFLTEIDLQTEPISNKLNVFIGPIKGVRNAIDPEHIGPDLYHQLTGYRFRTVSSTRNTGSPEKVKPFWTF